MIGMQSVAPPRVVTEHHFGLQLTNDARDLLALDEPRLQLAVGVTEEHDLTGRAERLRGGALLVLAHRDERGGVLARDPMSPSTRRCTRGGGPRSHSPPTFASVPPQPNSTSSG